MAVKKKMLDLPAFVKVFDLQMMIINDLTDPAF